MQSESLKLNSTNPNNISKITIKSHSKKKRTRKKIFWSEREEKTLFILQMALGTKFSIIKTFLKDKSVNDIKNHFYSKLRTYLSIQISKLKAENFFKDIDQNYYNLRRVLTLVLSNKITTMILNKNIIKELILESEQKKKNKNNLNYDNKEEKKDKLKIMKKRGRPKKKEEVNKANRSFKVKVEKNKNKIEGEQDKNNEIKNKKIFKLNDIGENNEGINFRKKDSIELNESE